MGIIEVLIVAGVVVGTAFSSHRIGVADGVEAALIYLAQEGIIELEDEE